MRRCSTAADFFLEPVERLSSQHQAGVALPQSLSDHLVDRQPSQTASHQLHRVRGLARSRKTAHRHHRAHLLRHGARLDRPTRRTYAVRAGPGWLVPAADGDRGDPPMLEEERRRAKLLRCLVSV